MQINEFHYDNINLDVNQFIEFRHTEPLKGYEVILYNGDNGILYNRTDLSNFPPTTVTRVYNYTVVPFSQLANGVEGIALKAPNGSVLEFISYEGMFKAKNGPAEGMHSVDIKVSESNICTSAGFSLQKCANNGVWVGPTIATPGKLNRNCTNISTTKSPSTQPCGSVVPSPVAIPVKPPVKAPVVPPPTNPDTPPATSPVTAPVTAPVKAPVAAPVKAPVAAPVMQPPTNPDAPTSKPEKCGLFGLGIFCPFECGVIKRALNLC